MDTDKLCIFIASHISNPKRIHYLKECLLSLISQTHPITIYLSISFQSDELVEKLKTMLEGSPEIQNSGKFVLRIREQKTPQMRHIKYLYNEIMEHGRHDWIMFCDDDDTYTPDRVCKIGTMIVNCLQINVNDNQQFVGVYESTFGKDHRENRHEFWCYCVHRNIISRFLEKLDPYPDVLDNKCCDVMFGEYLRRSNPNLFFSRLEEQCYHYRVEDNSDSVTGYIKTYQHHYTVKSEPPAQTDPAWAEYVVDWNEYLHQNIDVYLHDVYLRTLVGCDLVFITQQEFRANTSLLPFVDSCHLEKIKTLHNQVRTVCNLIYDIPF